MLERGVSSLDTTGHRNGSAEGSLRLAVSMPGPVAGGCLNCPELHSLYDYCKLNAKAGVDRKLGLGGAKGRKVHNAVGRIPKCPTWTVMRVLLQQSAVFC
jgi:hypothetical protein